MRELILARHGETTWNAQEKFRGRRDLKLNKRGTRQAELLAEYLSSVKIEAIYSSPLKRALQTAEAIARHHKLDVQIAPVLIDIDYGRWQGLSLDEVKTSYKELYAAWSSHPELITIPDGESLEDIRERAITIIDGITAKHQDTVLLVSHRVVNKVLICALLGMDNSHFWNVRLDTGGITTFLCENDRFILTEHNNTSYLKEAINAKRSDF